MFCYLLYILNYGEFHIIFEVLEEERLPVRDLTFENRVLPHCQKTQGLLVRLAIEM